MDNSHLGHPSPEWVAYGAAHPHLNINAAADHAVPDPVTIRDSANKAKEASVQALLSETGLGSRVTTTDHHALARDGARLPVRVYRAAQPLGSSPLATETKPPAPFSESPTAALVYYHGGGMLLGSLSTEDYLCSVWADALGPDVAIVSICYRHTPEFAFPTQHHDAWDAFAWVVDHAATLGIDTAKIVVGGISSGGGLAASVVQAELNRRKNLSLVERDPEKMHEVRIRGQIVAMPWLIHRDVYPLDEWFGSSSSQKEKSSVVQCRNAPIMCAKKYGLFTDLLRVKDGGKGFSVGLATEEELEGSPPTAVLVCGWDMLRDEAMAFAGRIEAAGTPTKKHVFPGLPHSFTKYPDLPSSRRFNDLVVESVRWCLEADPRPDEPGRWEMEGYCAAAAAVVEPHHHGAEAEQQAAAVCASDGMRRRWIPELRGNRWGVLF